MHASIARFSRTLPIALAFAAGCAPTPDDDTAVDALTDPSLTTIRVEATLTHTRCTDTENGTCGTSVTLFRPRSESSSVVFAGGDLRKIVPGARVRVGPFHLVKSERNRDDPAGTTVTYTVRLMARSPALYEPAAGGGSRFVGAQTTAREVGRATVTLRGTATQDVYVSAVLPGVFTSLYATATVGTASGSWPSGCGALPATSPSTPDALSALDNGCIQTVVTPTGVLQPAWLPVAIVYEPPGNCSWTNLTRENIAGSVQAVTQDTDTQTTVLRDQGFFWDRQHTNTWTRDIASDRRALEARVGTAITVGTRLAGSPQSPGNPQCSVVGATVPARPDAGPGRGDLYVLLRNPQLLAWSTGGASNVTMRPGSRFDLRVVSALQMATGVGLGPDEVFTDGDRRALLALDPFVDPVDPFVRDAVGRVTDVRVRTSPSLASDRFVPIGVSLGTSAGYAIDYNQTQQMTLTNGQSLASATRQAVEQSSQPDPAASLALSGVQYAATGLATAVGSLVPVPGFGALAGQVVGSIFPLYTNSTTVTTVTTLTSTTLHEQLAANSVAQQFHLQDTRVGVTVSLSYDRLFGTFVFLSPSSPFVLIPRQPGVITFP